MLQSKIKSYFPLVLSVLSLFLSVKAQSSLDQNIENAVVAYVKEQARLRGDDSVVAEIRSLPAIPSSLKERVSVHVVEGSVRVFKNNCTVPVELVQKQRAIFRLLVSVRIRLFGPVLYTRNRLDRHSIPSAGDLITRYVETTTLPDDILHTTLALDGKRTSRIISAGSVLTESVMELIPVIAADDLVTLIAHTGTVQVSTQAIAKDPGGMGAVITVQKIGSHQKLRARIINKRMVELQID